MATAIASASTTDDVSLWFYSLKPNFQQTAVETDAFCRSMFLPAAPAEESKQPNPKGKRKSETEASSSQKEEEQTEDAGVTATAGPPPPKKEKTASIYEEQMEKLAKEGLLEISHMLLGSDGKPRITVGDFLLQRWLSRRVSSTRA